MRDLGQHRVLVPRDRTCSRARRDAAAFGDQSFRQGLAARSAYLGDPTNPRSPGHRSHWVVGGPKNEADILVIVAADDAEDLVTSSTRSSTSAADAGSG